MKNPLRSRLLFLSLSFFLLNYAFAQQTCQGSLMFDNSTNTSVWLPINNQYYTGTNNGFTWECWFQLNTVPGGADRQLISSIDSVFFEDIVLGFGWSGVLKPRGTDSLIFKVDGAPSSAPDLDCAWAPLGGFLINHWYHAAGVIDYTLGKKWLYVDGIPRDSQAVTVAPMTRNIRTTLSSCNTCGSANSMNGYMDEVRIWSRPLSHSEIVTYMNQCRIGNELDFVAYYRCNQVGALNVLDATSNTNMGWFLNPPTPGWSNQNAPVSGTVCDSICKCQGSLVFDTHTNPAVNLPLTTGGEYYDGTTNNGYTWETWFKLNSSPSTIHIDKPLISAIDPTPFEDMYLGFGWHSGYFNRGLDSIVFKVDGPSSAPPTDVNCAWAPKGGFVIGQWYHVAGVADYHAAKKYLYVNGTLQDVRPMTVFPNTRAIQTNLGECSVCAALSSFDGKMDEVRIWNKPMSGSDINAYYQQCRAGTETDLILYYRCNQVGASTVIDGSSSSYTGAFFNLPNWSTENAPVFGTCMKDCNSADGAQDPPKGKTVGIQTLSSTNGGLKIYPNPSSGSIKVSAEQPGVLTVYSVTGQVLSKIQVQKSENEIKLEGFKSGIYLYIFTSGSSTSSGKLVIEN